MTAPIALVIDTDPALGIIHDGRPRDVDDGLAIIEAINAPAIDLRAITVTYGNAPLDKAVAVARELLRLKEAALPMAAGASAAMPQNGAPAPVTPAVQLLAKLLADQPLHLAAIGPLTNIGTLLQHIPGLAGRIESLVMVAGRTRGNRFFLGDVGPVRDFNLENDPLAARLVLDSGIPVVMAGFELSSAVAVTAEHLRVIRRRGTRAGDNLYRKAQAWLQHWTETFPADRGFHPWDSAAIAWYSHPEYFVTEQRGWQLRTVHRETGASANPDQSPDTVVWLETHAELPGPQVTYCTGFAEGAAEAFLNDVVGGVW